LKLENQQYPDSRIIHLLKLIAHPLRLKILRLLVYEQEICTCEIVPVFGATSYDNNETKYSSSSIQVQITKQLTKLKKEGILESRKISFTSEGEVKDKDDGKWTSYKISDEYLTLIKQIIEVFSSDSSNSVEIPIQNVI
ncbi:MAG: ArsR/SmtB family transcription factor, partial [Candidatus Hodarchaeales archaeon]